MLSYAVTKNCGTCYSFGPVIPNDCTNSQVFYRNDFLPQVFKQVFALRTGPGKIAFIFKPNPMASIGFRLSAEKG